MKIVIGDGCDDVTDADDGDDGDVIDAAKIMMMTNAMMEDDEQHS